MLDFLKHAGKNVRRGLSRTWDYLAEGWQELFHHSSEALTHFSRKKDEDTATAGTFPVFRNWSLLAGEIEETDKEVVVRIEVPGIEKKDCQITVDGDMLYLRGEKHLERVTNESTYHITERAYGVFQRAIPLPAQVDADNAEATYKNGVLTVRLPRVGGGKGRLIPLS